MASVRYLVLAACQRAGLRSQAGWEEEAAAWIEKQGNIPCAYVGYRRGIGVAGYDNITVVFGGSNPSAALRRVRDSLERSLEFRSERQTEVGGFPALVMTARAKKRVYFVYGGGIHPEPPTPVYENPFTVTAAEYSSSNIQLLRYGNAKIVELEYSLNGGEWTLWKEVNKERLLMLQLGDTVRIRNTSEEATKFSFGATNRYQFNVMSEEGGLVKLSGDLRSLLKKAYYKDLSPEAGTFHSLFSGNDFIKDISELVLAAPVFKANVYNSLFSGTAVSGKAAITGNIAQNSCFSEMFRYTNITDITVTVNTNEGGFSDWLANVSAEGIVRCYPELSLPEGSGSGIPEGWTREDLQA